MQSAIASTKRRSTRSFATRLHRGRSRATCAVGSEKPGNAIQPTPAAATFVLLLGYAVGRRGRMLFETPWTAILDMGPDELIDLAVDARRLGLLDLKQSGSIIDVSFRAFFTEKEREWIDGSYRQVG